MQLKTVIIKLIIQLITWIINRNKSKVISTQPSVEPSQDSFEATEIALPLQDTLIQTKTEPVNPTKQIITDEKIVKKFLSSSQYVQDSKFKPRQIVLHHTNGASAKSTFDYWNSNPDRICTHFLIDRDGTILQCIPLEKAWGYHIYVVAKDNKIPKKYKNLGSNYDKQSIGIELASMSQLKPYKGKFLDTYGEVFKGEIFKLEKPFRGEIYFEKYTSKQIEALEYLLLYLLQEYPEIADYIKTDFTNSFDVDLDALNMKPGIYHHVSYRSHNKWDCYPDPDLIKILNNLHTKV